MKTKAKVIVVIGPTASGKSALAVALAKKIKGEVISADSRQVYRKLDLGSGKITQKEKRGVPHHLLDVVGPRTVFTAARYQKLARETLKDIWRRGRIPIICGGTALYIDALLEGWRLPAGQPSSRLRRELEKLSTEELYRRLRRADPRRSLTIDRHNPRRLIRALEINQTRGKVPVLRKNPLSATIVWIGLRKTREELRRAITRRLFRRLRQGMIKEAERLRRNRLSWKRLESLGLEYRLMALYLRKKITRKEMEEKIVRESLSYAKRQMTWWRRNKNIIWFDKKPRLKELTDLVR